MARPRKCRRVGALPPATFYKPRGVPLSGLPVATLSVDGFEALRLADAEGLDHQAAAERMGVSRPTFTRLVAEARAVVARALVNGWALGIGGGRFEVEDGAASPRCCGGGRRRRPGAGEPDETTIDDETMRADRSSPPRTGGTLPHGAADGDD